MEKYFSNDSAMYKQMLDSMYEGIYFVDKNRKIIYWSKGAERISGYSSNEVIGLHCHDNVLNHLDDNGRQMCRTICPLRETINDGDRREGGFYMLHKDGHRLRVAVKTMPLYVNGEIVGGIEVFIDDSHMNNFNEELTRLKVYAMHDTLTELPNRRYIDSFLENRFLEHSSLKIPFGVLMFDIDDFKQVNDKYGHDVGDVVLKEVAKTLSNAFRKNDLVGRWGGEEFMAVLSGVEKDELLRVAEKARRMVESLIIKSKNEELTLTVSVGASMHKEYGEIASLVKRADKALYSSKKAGKNRVTYL